MFDFANQAYTLLIVTVIFGDVFTRLVVADAPDYRLSNLLWSLALGLSALAVALVNPSVGRWADATGQRKQALLMITGLLVVTSTALYGVTPGAIALAFTLVLVSHFAFALGEGLIASFLTDLAPPDRLGWISGLGWGLGYIGGLLATLVTLSFIGPVTLENFDQLRWVGPLCAAFVVVGTIPTFIWLKDRRTPRAAAPEAEGVPVTRWRDAWAQLADFPDLKRLLVSVFFSMSGIAIIVSFAFLYGAQVIGWDDEVRVMMFVIVQLTAAIGAFSLGWLQDRWGPRQVYLLSQMLWVVAILAIWQTPTVTRLINAWAGVSWEAQYVFLVAGVLAGLSLGSAQSAGRALIGLLTPPARSAEFFGWWGTSAKLAMVFGLVGLGLLQTWLGLANAIVFCAFLFFTSSLLAARVSIPRGLVARDRSVAAGVPAP